MASPPAPRGCVPAPPLADICAVCGSPADSLCAGCHVRVYCGRRCQAADRRAHRAECRAITTAPSATPAGASEGDVAFIDRGEWACISCGLVIVAAGGAERCGGCRECYCTRPCRLSHWPAHMEACVAASVARVDAGEGRLGGMEATLVSRLAQARRGKGDDDAKTLEAMHDLAGMQRQEGKHREAEALYRELLARCERLIGEDHPNTFAVLGGLALVLSDQGRHAEVLRLKCGCKHTARH